MTQKRSDPAEGGALAEQIGEIRDQGNAPDLLVKALRYADAGWPVFPCHWTTDAGCSCGQPCGRDAGKHPLTPHGFKDASADRDVITTWWTQWPTANVALATGGQGPDVLDFDVKGDAPGAESLAKLRAAGLLGGANSIITTPTGGWHLYYLGSDQGNGAIRRHGVDFRSLGGYALAPPSVIHGKAYTVTDWRSRFDPAARGIDFAAVRRVLDPPPLFAKPVRTGGPSNHDALIRHVTAECVVAGNCNNALFWAACRAAESAAPDQVFRDLVDAAVAGGHPVRGAEKTVASARRRNGAAA